jgi:3(or 17)beta-hydroxysteroid dehydrogenase
MPMAGTAVAVVTGASEGIGRAIAGRLARDGMHVVVADIQDDKGESAARELGGTYLHCDVSLEPAWNALADMLSERFGRLDVLVNNAGINPAPQNFASYPLSSWQRMFAVNLDGVFLGCRMAVNAMREGGAIVNIASAAARKPVGEMAGYCSSKSAACMLTRTVALYCAQRGLNIRCNAVLPGSIETPLVNRLRDAAPDPAAARAAATARHPIGFIGEPSDIADMVSFLASAEARFITGAEFCVDGGLTL